MLGGDEFATYREHIRDQHKLGRFGRPEEIVAVAFFLASDHSSFLTGQIIALDGRFKVSHRLGFTKLMGLE